MPESIDYQVPGIRLAVDAPDSELPRLTAEQLGCLPGDIVEIEVLKRSIDARGRGKPVFDLLVRATLSDPLAKVPESIRVWQPQRFEPMPTPHSRLADERVVVIGSGPCGLFAAIALAERGVPCTILDRGEPVDPRAKSVSRLMGKGDLNPDSNLCYGEGGAGTFSDGKLRTRVGGDDVARVIHKMIELGAPPDIAVDRRPHLGTDRLIRLIKGIRAHLEDLGVDFRFNTRVERIVSAGARGALTLSDGEIIDAHHVVLAAGHSARSLYRNLRAEGVALQPKPFAVGFRVEHPQALINEIQYGRYSSLADLPPADYSATFNRGTDVQVYSFCMCPGGSIVPTATRPDHVCVNGMSHAARSGRYANSAIVTTVLPEELEDLGDPLLAGVRFQERAEGMAAKLGGGRLRAPSTALLDYLAGQPSTSVRRSTYRCGIEPADLSLCYGDAINARLRAGLAHFEKRLNGFSSADAILIGVETRTSAPLRVVRDRSSRSPTHPFLYPGGEGAGHAGGIASAAVDGLRIARSILTGR